MSDHSSTPLSTDSPDVDGILHGTITRRNLIRSTVAIAGMAAVANTPVGVFAAPRPSSDDQMALQDDVQTNVEVTISLLPYGQPVTLDPHRTVNWGPFWTLFPHVWSGLLRFDQNGAVEADLAESVTPNDDLTVWTAKLRSGISFASGKAITANDFVTSWQRALDPGALSPMSVFLAPIKGATDYAAGKSKDLGVRAIDDQNVEITLTEGFAAFPYYLATFVYAVLDSEVLANASESNPFLSDAGAGAWRFTEFVDDDHIVMEPNSKYWDDPSPSVTKVTWSILSGDDAESVALQAYASDATLSADVPLSLYDQANGDETLKNEIQTVSSQGSTLAIGLDFNQAPFTDVRVRKAVAAAIDRGAWAKDIWKDSFAPANGFTAPVAAVNGYTAPEGIAFNVDQAKSWLSDAEYDPADNATDIVYYQPATDSAEDQQRHAQLLKMIEDNIGLVIRQDTTLTVDQISALQTDNGGRQFDIVWWWPDAEPQALLDRIGTSTSSYMAGWFNWSKDLDKSGDLDPGADSASFDELIAKARTTGNQDDRNASYQSAEKLLLDNAVYIPLGYWVQRYVQKPWLQGTKQGPWTGRIPVRFDKDVVVRGKPE